MALVFESNRYGFLGYPCSADAGGVSEGITLDLSQAARCKWTPVHNLSGGEAIEMRNQPPIATLAEGGPPVAKLKPVA